MTVLAEHPTTTDVRTHYVYRLYDAAGRLLYVGMTNDPGQRLRDHKRTKPWWGEVYRQDIQETATRADAFFIEAAAILQEKPAYNLDIPSLDRYDVLKSRSTVADPMTTGDRIAALEHQLREARRELHRAAGSGQALAEAQADAARLTAENARLRAANAEDAEKHRAGQESLQKLADMWQYVAESRKTELDAREEVRVFVVEGPRTYAPAPQPAPAVTAPAPRRTILQRILG